MKHGLPPRPGSIVTGVDGYTVRTTYDDLDRPVQVDYPDNTYEQMIYTKLDATAHRDRAGRWTRTTYDAMRRVTGVTDPLGRRTGFEWCECGALEKIVDAEGNETWFFYDEQGRLTEKKYDDMKGLSYGYEPHSGRLSTMTDAKNQQTQYRYNTDNTLESVSYVDATTGVLLERTMEGRKIDAGVSFGYDAWYRRVASMTDGTGTTSYTYWPVGGAGAGRLWTENGPLAGTVDQVTHTYDEYGRETGLAVGTGAEATSEGRVFDALGRVEGVGNGLGVFVYGYVGDTGRLGTVSYPNGVGVSYDYHPANAGAGTGNGDFRLKQIVNAGPGSAVLSQFDYGYDATGNITSWTQAQGGAGKVWTLGYDSADQLVSVAVPGADVAAGEAGQSEYRYDFAGNRRIEERDGAAVGAGHNALNQMTGRNGAVKRVVFSGTSDEVGPVTVGGQQAVVVPDGNGGSTWSAELALGNGTHKLPVKGADVDGNARDYELTATVSGAGIGGVESFAYDDNGNLTNHTTVSPSFSTSYEWDAANRLVSVTKGNERSLFAYNGRGQRVRQIEQSRADAGAAWVAVSDHTLVWNGLELKAERDTGSGAEVRRFWAQGFQSIDSQLSTINSHYYTRDHLGSVREVTDNAGAVQARYAYDAWGRRRRLPLNGTSGDQGTVEAPHGFTGHYYHAWSGLHLAFYRAYDAELGRWLSRDPLGEAGGFTLYDYALNSPIMLVDELGLKAGSMKCESRVSAGHPGQVDQEERAFWSNREHPKCGSKFYGISCGIRANGHYVWGSEKQRQDAAAKPDVDENGNTNVKPSPGDPLLRDMLAEKLELAEKDAIAQCRKPDNCCQTILIKADCIPSPDDLTMKNARVYDRRLDELCRTKKTIDCRTIQ